MPPRPACSCLVLDALRGALFNQHVANPGLRRQMSTRRKAPARMALSLKVAIPRRRPSNSLKSKVDGPFGAMNQTEAPAKLRLEKEAPARDGKRHGLISGKRERRSQQPFKHLKMQKRLAEISYSARSEIKAGIRDLKSFDTFNLLPVVKEAVKVDVLGGLDMLAPTAAQRVAIPILLAKPSRRKKVRSVDELVNSPEKMREFLLAAETGSGKTLAYLLPAINHIKSLEAAGEVTRSPQEVTITNSEKPYELPSPVLATGETEDTARPKVIILVPTSELVAQVGRVAKAMSHKAKIRVAMISSAYSATVIRKRLFAPAGVDVVISTPHLLASIADTEPNILSQVEYLVLDEADSLLDRSFLGLTSSIIDRATPSLEKLIFCSATIPRSMDSYLEKRFPDVTRLVTPNLHAIPRRVQLSVIDIDKVPYQGNRNLACADMLQKIDRQISEPDPEDPESEDPKQRNVIVFVNERLAANNLAIYLRSKGILALSFNRDTRPEEHGSVLEPFTSPNFKPEPEEKDAPGTRRLVKNLKVLVTTDLGSRGIDTVTVRDVVLYDVPHTTVDFIHRLGRTGRMGRRGRGYVFVSKHDRKDIVREVKEGMFKGSALI